jgi:hypothetical protein
MPAQGARTQLPVYFLYHLPKCAGQTIDRHLARFLPASAYHKTRKRRGIGRLLFTRLNIEAMPAPSRIKVVGGHFLGRSVERSFAGREIRRCILLRDPVSHLVSYYNFRMMRYLSEGRSPYSFELAYSATQRNFITHYVLRNFLEMPWPRLVGLSDEEKYEIVNAFLATFWFVGDFKLCDELISALGPQLGIPHHAPRTNTQAEWERRVTWRPLEADDLPATALARIRQENRIDQRLWESWNEARHDTAWVRPKALGSAATPGFVATEALRLVSQIARRIERRRRGFAIPGSAGLSKPGAAGLA